jgi:predicted nucleic acid-binding protein
MIGYFDSSVILAILFNEEKQEEALKYWNDANTKSNTHCYGFRIIEEIIIMKISTYIVLILICMNLLLNMDF